MRYTPAPGLRRPESGLTRAEERGAPGQTRAPGFEAECGSALHDPNGGGGVLCRPWSIGAAPNRDKGSPSEGVPRCPPNLMSVWLVGGGGGPSGLDANYPPPPTNRWPEAPWCGGGGAWRGGSGRGDGGVLGGAMGGGVQEGWLGGGGVQAGRLGVVWLHPPPLP